MWLTNLKIAVVQEDTKLLSKLLDDVPTSLKNNELIQAINLLNQASVILYKLKDETVINMKKIKQNIDFIKNSQNDKQSGFSVCG